jgi:hypothetical protein
MPKAKPTTQRKFKQLCVDKPGDTPCKVPPPPPLKRYDLHERSKNKSLAVPKVN